MQRWACLRQVSIASQVISVVGERLKSSAIVQLRQQKRALSAHATLRAPLKTRSLDTVRFFREKFRAERICSTCSSALRARRWSSSVTGPVTARKDDVPAADQAAITNVVGLVLFSGSGGLIQTTSG